MTSSFPLGYFHVCISNPKSKISQRDLFTARCPSPEPKPCSNTANLVVNLPTPTPLNSTNLHIIGHTEDSGFDYMEKQLTSILTLKN